MGYRSRGSNVLDWGIGEEEKERRWESMARRSVVTRRGVSMVVVSSTVDDEVTWGLLNLGCSMRPWKIMRFLMLTGPDMPRGTRLDFIRRNREWSIAQIYPPPGAEDALLVPFAVEILGIRRLLSLGYHVLYTRSDAVWCEDLAERLADLSAHHPQSDIFVMEASTPKFFFVRASDQALEIFDDAIKSFMYEMSHSSFVSYLCQDYSAENRTCLNYRENVYPLPTNEGWGNHLRDPATEKNNTIQSCSSGYLSIASGIDEDRKREILKKVGAWYVTHHSCIDIPGSGP